MSADSEFEAQLGTAKGNLTDRRTFLKQVAQGALIGVGAVAAASLLPTEAAADSTGSITPQQIEGSAEGAPGPGSGGGGPGRCPSPRPPGHPIYDAFGRVNVRDYGAAGNGICNDTRAIQSALDAGAGRTVYFPAGTYLLTDAVRPSSGTTLEGAGYGTNLMMHRNGWYWYPQGTHYDGHIGMVTLLNVKHVRVTNMRFTGTLLAPPPDKPDTPPERIQEFFNPQLIYIGANSPGAGGFIKVDHCWFEQNWRNAIWEGGFPAENTQIIVEANHFSEIGYTLHPTTGGGSKVAGVAVQCSFGGATIIGNSFRRVGTAIAATGADLVCTGNIVQEFLGTAVLAGDQTILRNIAITGNVLEATILEDHNHDPTVGFQLTNSTNDLQPAYDIVVSGNSVHFLVNYPQHKGVLGFSATDIDATFSGNTVEVEFAEEAIGKSHLGFHLVATKRDVTVRAIGNTVNYYTNAARSYGGGCRAFFGEFTGGNTLTAYSASNLVKGLPGTMPQPPQGAGDAYVYSPGYLARGRIVSTMNGDVATGGFILNGTFIYQYDKPIFARHDTADGPIHYQSPVLYPLLPAVENGERLLARADDGGLHIGQRIGYGDSIPTAGVWNPGDIIFNTAPQSGGWIGWVCVGSGTQPVWSLFGAILPM